MLRSLSFAHNDAFTLAEVLITLVIIGIIAAITVPTMIAKYHEEQTVAKVKRMYSTITQLVQQYQFENSCTKSIANCFESGDFYNNSKFYKKIEKNLNIVHKLYPGDSLVDVNWLPDSNIRMNGVSYQDQHTWYGVYKPGAKSSQNVFYGLADGSIIIICMPDSYMQSGFVFFDTNGKKKPNRVGKDQFPIGIGAYNNQKYKAKVHPYFNEDDGSNFGLCNIRNNNECNPDECNQSSCSPTAYVLKHNKLPHINW